MKYTKEQLQLKNLYALREIGRGIGVKAPTSLTKGILIDQIIKVQDGLVEPCFPVCGRPSLDSKFTARKKKQKNADNLIAEIDKILQEAKDKLLRLICNT